jgi:hypothetical protein
MALVEKKVDPIIEGRRFAWGTRTGTRTAADFTVTLGFQPTHIRVVNLTSRAEALYIVEPNLDGGSNGKGVLTVAAGTRTYADVGISLTSDGLGFAVDVSVATLESDNCDLYWEASQ